jgi:hypothetical protein
LNRLTQRWRQPLIRTADLRVVSVTRSTTS